MKRSKFSEAQIAFVLGAPRRVCIRLPPGAQLLPAYAIGRVAMFWVVQRSDSF